MPISSRLYDSHSKLLEFWEEGERKWKREREMEREREREKVREMERKRLRVEEDRVKERNKQELKAIIREIQEEVQTNVAEKVVAILQTFIGDVGVLLRHLLKGDMISTQNHEETMETAEALQVLHQFDLEDSELHTSSEGGNTKGTESNQEMNRKEPKVCQCGNAIRQYQNG